MNIWLDDIRPAPQGFIHVRNLAELESLLNDCNAPIEIMSFDHDLGDGEPDGYEIIKWLANEWLGRWPGEVRVHSANPVGAKNICLFAENVCRYLL